MSKQLFEPGTPDLSRASPQRPRMINDPVHGGRLEMAASQVDHGVKWQVLLELSVEEEIAGQRASYVACHAVCVELLQRLGVGELSEGAIVHVRGDEWSRAHTE